MGFVVEALDFEYACLMKSREKGKDSFKKSVTNAFFSFLLSHLVVS